MSDDESGDEIEILEDDGDDDYDDNAGAGSGPDYDDDDEGNRYEAPHNIDRAHRATLLLRAVKSCDVCQGVLGDGKEILDLYIAFFHTNCFYSHYGHGTWGADGIRLIAPLPLPRLPSEPPLPRLFPELWGIIASFLPPISLDAFRLVCKRWQKIADLEFRSRVQRRTEMEMDLYAVSPTKLRIGVPISEGAIGLYKKELKECALSEAALIRQVLLWAADGGQVHLLRKFISLPSMAKHLRRNMQEMVKRAAASGETAAVATLLADCPVACWRGERQAWVVAARGGYVKLMEFFAKFPSVETRLNADVAEEAAGEAAFGGQTALVHSFRQQYKLDERNSFWRIILHEACAGGHAALVEEVLKKQLSSHAIDSAMTAVVQFGRGHLIERLINAGATISPRQLDYAAYGGKTAMVAEILRRLPATFKDYGPAIVSAASEGNDEVLELFQQWPPAQDDKNWNRALIHAAQNGNLSTVHLLLKRPSIVSDRTHLTRAIREAKQSGHMRIVHLLNERVALLPAKEKK